MKLQLPELLAPAGNLEKLKIALAYGADAIYLGGRQFGLRAYADNFNLEDMKVGIDYAHGLGKKVYVTMNIFARNNDFDGMEDYVHSLKQINADAVILSDPGILELVKETEPELEIHLSTQANNTNYRSAIFWHKLGVRRIILARELSLDEIKCIRNNTPDTLELEAFIHGAMCMSYSGRCTISNYLSGRDANQGECTQPCRWKYNVVEEKRPGEYMPIIEDTRGTYLFNSKDLCMLDHIPQLLQVGLSSLKIEGRMKSAYYAASVIAPYRKELNTFARDPDGYVFDPKSMLELKKASHRPFTTGFYLGKLKAEGNQFEDSSYNRSYQFVARLLESQEERLRILVEQRNHFQVGEKLEIMQPGEDFLDYTVSEMYDEEMNPISTAPHPQQKIYLPFHGSLKPWSIFRRKNK
ncbi:MAG TPA: peptidase U32 [Clostridiales bacterium]|nr:peptidase U32 [Clostridiales bacterium]